MPSTLLKTGRRKVWPDRYLRWRISLSTFSLALRMTGYFPQRMNKSKLSTRWLAPISTLISRTTAIDYHGPNAASKKTLIGSKASSNLFSFSTALCTTVATIRWERCWVIYWGTVSWTQLHCSQCPMTGQEMAFLRLFRQIITWRTGTSSGDQGLTLSATFTIQTRASRRVAASISTSTAAWAIPEAGDLGGRR